MRTIRGYYSKHRDKQDPGKTTRENDDLNTSRIIYRGTVQGVGFRFRTENVATRYTITGYVKNIADGDVELVAQGTAAEIERFLAGVSAEMGRLITGSHAAIVDDAPVFDTFDIAY